MWEAKKQASKQPLTIALSICMFVWAWAWVLACTFLVFFIFCPFNAASHFNKIEQKTARRCADIFCYCFCLVFVLYAVYYFFPPSVRFSHFFFYKFINTHSHSYTYKSRMFLFLIVLNSLMAHFMVENYIPPNEFERMKSAIGRVEFFPVYT